VSTGFTPKEIARAEPKLRAKAAQIVDDVLDTYGDGTEFDFLTEVAGRLPLHAICDMMGVPTADQDLIYDWTNLIVTVDDPNTSVEGAANGSRSLAEYAFAIGEERLRHPTDDLTSALMHAEVDGERLTTKDFANFFILLLAAGNETTRNAISHGLRLLTRFPDQRRIWFDDFDAVAPTAVEEIVRYEPLISNMCRVLTQDVEIRGVHIAAGEKVALWYPSANRDEEVFVDADTFDVRRPLHPQQTGYGGGGPHFCLGANLARKEMTVMFDEIRRRMPTLEVTGEPEWVLSMALNAMRRLPARIV
jgi:cytochrome P450